MSKMTRLYFGALQSQVSGCMEKAYACRTHGTFEGYKMGALIQLVEQQGEGGGREKRKGGKEKRKGGKEKKRKGMKKRGEEKGGRREKERGKGRSVAQRADPNDKELGTALQEVGFLLLWLFYA